MKKDLAHRSRNKVEVRLLLEDGKTLEGSVFCSHEERISDILNDSREFLPFETSAGESMVLRKGIIAQITTRKKSEMEESSANPHEINQTLN